jgi:hypothetical protein
MALVVVERSFEEPQVFDDLQAAEHEKSWCLEQNGVEFVRSYFSLDRKRMACVYNAPSADVVRRVQDTTGLPYDTVWTAGLLSELLDLGPRPELGGRSIVIVERDYGQRIPVAAIDDYRKQWAPCFQTNSVSLLESYVRTDDLGSLCVLAAPDADTARRANRTAGAPLKRAWSATIHEPN